MKVSVLVPVYGVEQYISQCAKSLFEQDYEDIEFIFVNDCTKDKSIQILLDLLEEYPNRKEQVKIINHLQNKGLPAARNTALENASGEYVLPFDSDDFLSQTNAITDLMNEAIKHNADAVFYNMILYPNTNQSFSFHIPLKAKELTIKIISRETYMSLCGGMYKKSLFLDNGIKSIENISMGEDYAIKPKLTYYMKNIRHLPQAYYCYRQNNNNAITKKFQTKHTENLRQCIDEFYKFFKSKPDYNDYKEAIIKAEIRCKILCLKSWLYHSGSNNDFLTINELFPYNHNAIKYLSFSDYCLYKLASYRNVKILKMIASLKKIF